MIIEFILTMKEYLIVVTVPVRKKCDPFWKKSVNNFVKREKILLGICFLPLT